MEDSTYFHGGIGKVATIREMLNRARNERNSQQWEKLHYWLEGLYMELQAWIDKKEHKQLEHNWIQLELELVKVKRREPHNYRDMSRFFELTLRQYNKDSGLDAPVIPTETGIAPKDWKPPTQWSMEEHD